MPNELNPPSKRKRDETALDNSTAPATQPPPPKRRDRNIADPFKAGRDRKRSEITLKSPSAMQAASNRRALQSATNRPGHSGPPPLVSGNLKSPGSMLALGMSPIPGKENVGIAREAAKAKRSDAPAAPATPAVKGQAKEAKTAKVTVAPDRKGDSSTSGENSGSASGDSKSSKNDDRARSTASDELIVSFSFVDPKEQKLNKDRPLKVSYTLLNQAGLKPERKERALEKGRFRFYEPIKYWTVSRYLQCITTDSKYLPIYDAHSDDDGGDESPKIEWSHDNLTDLYLFAQKMGTYTVCNKITDHYRLWFKNSKRNGMIGRYSILGSVLGFVAKHLNAIAAEDPDAPILYLFADILDRSEEFGWSPAETPIGRANALGGFLLEGVSAILNGTDLNPRKLDRCRRYHIHEDGARCGADPLAEVKAAPTPLQKAERQTNNILKRVKGVRSRIEKRLGKASSAENGNTLEHAIKAQKRAEKLLKQLEELDAEMTDSENE